MCTKSPRTKILKIISKITEIIGVVIANLAYSLPIYGLHPIGKNKQTKKKKFIVRLTKAHVK